MNSPFLVRLGFELAVGAIGFDDDLAFSTGWPCMSLTMPRTIPVDWAAAGRASIKVASATHATSHTCRPFTRRTMGILLEIECNSRFRASLPRFN
jgi:hypothetical protein